MLLSFTLWSHLIPADYAWFRFSLVIQSGRGAFGTNTIGLLQSLLDSSITLSWSMSFTSLSTTSQQLRGEASGESVPPAGQGSLCNA